MKVALIALLFVGSLFSQPRISQAKLDSLAQRWRHVLQLDDWQVTVRAVRIDDLPEGSAAASETIPQVRTLRVWVLDPKDYPELAKRSKLPEKHGRQILADIEDSVLHELLHLRLRDYRQASEEALPMTEELTVVRLTNALLRPR